MSWVVDRPKYKDRVNADGPFLRVLDALQLTKNFLKVSIAASVLG